MIVVKRKMILTWLGVALVLAIVVSGVSVAEYHAEVLYDYRFKFILEMILMPLLLQSCGMMRANLTLTLGEANNPSSGSWTLYFQNNYRD